MHDALDDRIRRALQAEVAELPLAVTPQMVEERLARPAIPTLFAVVGGAAAVAMLVAMVAFAIGSRLPNVGPAATPSVTDSPAPGPDGSAWRWMSVDVPARAPGEARDVLSDGQRFYVVGRSGASMSADGERWTTLSGLPPRPGYSVAAAAAGSGRLLIAWAADSSDPVIATLVEGERIVQSAEIRLAGEVLDGFATMEVVSAAVGPNGGLIHTAPRLDEAAIGAAAYGDELGDDRMVFIDGGVAYLEDGEGVRLDQVPLAELGIDAKALNEAARLWMSVDFETWTPVAASQPFDSAGLQTQGPVDLQVPIAGVHGGFVAGTGGVPLQELGGLWFSPDGERWQELEASVGAGPRLVPWRGRVLVGGDDGSILSAGSDGLVTISIPDPPDQVEGLGAGDAGIGYVNAERQRVVFSRDGRSWEYASVPEGFVEAAAACDWCWWSAGVWIGADAVLLTGPADEARRFWVTSLSDR